MCDPKNHSNRSLYHTMRIALLLAALAAFARGGEAMRSEEARARYVELEAVRIDR